MPMFEYKCQDCGKQFETLLKNRQETVTCECGSQNLTKLLSSFAVSEGSGSVSGCSDGSCSLPSSPCASGMCGLS